jgi:phosphoribosyl-AMP cyclohydrolase
MILQHVDTGELLMQAYADRAALCETLQTGWVASSSGLYACLAPSQLHYWQPAGCTSTMLTVFEQQLLPPAPLTSKHLTCPSCPSCPSCSLATFYSRSRKGRWCKGETSGNFIQVARMYQDCDRDSIIYLSDPIGPSCHTGARCAAVGHVGLQCMQGQQAWQQHGAVHAVVRRWACHHDAGMQLAVIHHMGLVCSAVCSHPPQPHCQICSLPACLPHHPHQDLLVQRGEAGGQ